MTSKLSLYDLYEIKKKKDAKLNDAFNIILNSTSGIFLVKLLPLPGFDCGHI